MVERLAHTQHTHNIHKMKNANEKLLEECINRVLVLILDGFGRMDLVELEMGEIRVVCKGLPPNDVLWTLGHAVSNLSVPWSIARQLLDILQEGYSFVAASGPMLARMDAVHVQRDAGWEEDVAQMLDDAKSRVARACYLPEGRLAIDMQFERLRGMVAVPVPWIRQQRRTALSEGIQAWALAQIVRSHGIPLDIGRVIARCLKPQT